MGKGKNKKKQETAPISKEYSVGTMADLIAQSCGVTKPSFDPKLASFFSNPSVGKNVRIREKTDLVFSAAPPRQDKVGQKGDKKELVLTNKDAANIRVGVKAKFSTADNIISQPGSTKNLKRLQNSSVQKVKKPRHRDRIENQVLEKGDNVETPVEAPSTQQDSTIDIKPESVEVSEAAPSTRKKGSVGEIKKTLRQLNAPKEKNPELESRTLFVGNVPKDATKKQLLKLFKSLGGTIETVRLRCAAPDKPTSLKKVAIYKKELHPDRDSIAAYVRYSSREEAEQIIKQSKEKSLTLSDHHLVLDLADRSLKRDNKKAIFVGNIHLKTQDNDVWEFFSECGQIESVRLVRDRDTGLGKGFGYVNFEDRAAVELALKKDGAEFKNRALRISRCVKKVKKTDNYSEGTGKGNFFPSGKPNVGNPDSKPSTGTGRPTNTNPKKISQGRRQRKEETQFSGDRIAEVGKFKRNSKKPNRDELKKARIAQQLSSTNLSSTDYKTKKKEMRKLNKPRWRNQPPSLKK